ncbi:hypothetical protein NQ318_022184 [Aromia moschata]|uniref:Glutathione-dependent dehydroascorbate reductase n=1 Tax=Aromia moschata TaxID=1265417 RepID=A0AAV8Z7L6_9CUCU|nr:hypothetical protein NQ318_022184 [Aromia moschata]
MSTKHLTVGSVEPPRAKGIPHDIVNINLMKKPEWYFKIHPDGKVPALLDGDEVMIESLDISDYLDEKYPENPLYPADPEAKRKHKELISQIGAYAGVFFKMMHKSEERTLEEWKDEVIAQQKAFEDELARRGTTFFGGDKPGMVDYMLWPWSEREDSIRYKLGAKLPFKEGDVPRMRKWKEAMLAQPVIKETVVSSETFHKLSEARRNGTLDYDNV